MGITAIDSPPRTLNAMRCVIVPNMHVSCARHCDYVGSGLCVGKHTTGGMGTLRV